MADKKDKTIKCKKCGGTGVIEKKEDNDIETCPDCGGKGEIRRSWWG